MACGTCREDLFLKTVIISIIKPRLSTIIKNVHVSSLLILTYVQNIVTIKIKNNLSLECLIDMFETTTLAIK